MYVFSVFFPTTAFSSIRQRFELNDQTKAQKSNTLTLEYRFFASFCDFSIVLWNCSDSVVFLASHFLSSTIVFVFKGLQAVRIEFF